MWRSTLCYRPTISLSRGRDRETADATGLVDLTMSVSSGGIWPYETVEWVKIQLHLHPGGNSLEDFGWMIQDVHVLN